MDIGFLSALLIIAIAHIVVAQSGGDNTVNSYVSDMARLRRMLFTERGYDATSRPTNDSSEPTIVRVALLFKSIKHVAIEGDWLKIVLSLCAYWKDHRLTWNAREYGDMAFIAVDAKDVWSPDLDVVNAREDFYSLKNMLTAQPDSSVWACSSVKVKAPCAVDMSGFPHDEQLCGIRITSTAYSDSQVKLAEGTVWGSHQDNASTEWNVTGISFAEHRALNRALPRARYSHASGCCGRTHFSPLPPNLQDQHWSSRCPLPRLQGASWNCSLPERS
ncbi:acetylcholine receptor subunit beta-type unc-29-like isoform X2 [Amblyomma americanum]